MHHAGGRRSFGPGKIAEMSGDTRKLLEVLLKSALANDDHEEAERLRKALHSQPNTQAFTEPSTQVDTEPLYTPEAKAKKPRKQQSKRTAKAPPPSKLTPAQASRLAWEELLRRRERA
jgi:hypothetical protein